MSISRLLVIVEFEQVSKAIFRMYLALCAIMFEVTHVYSLEENRYKCN